jgi:FRG domain
MASSQHCYSEVVVNTWDDAVTLGKVLSSRYVYRGQSGADWELTTLLSRKAEQHRIESFRIVRVEREMLRQFQRRTHHYVTDAPSIENDIEWLALMQHYGSPTRLLDFTHSFYVAAYFALRNASSDSAVWAVDRQGLRTAIVPTKWRSFTFQSMTTSALNCHVAF